MSLPLYTVLEDSRHCIVLAPTEAHSFSMASAAAEDVPVVFDNAADAEGFDELFAVDDDVEVTTPAPSAAEPEPETSPAPAIQSQVVVLRTPEVTVLLNIAVSVEIQPNLAPTISDQNASSGSVAPWRSHGSAAVGPRDPVAELLASRSGRASLRRHGLSCWSPPRTPGRSRSRSRGEP